MIKHFVLNIIRLFHYVVNYSICGKIVAHWRTIYSYWIQLEFGQVGSGVYIGKMYLL